MSFHLCVNFPLPLCSSFLHLRVVLLQHLRVWFLFPLLLWVISQLGLGFPILPFTQFDPQSSYPSYPSTSIRVGISHLTISPIMSSITIFHRISYPSYFPILIPISLILSSILIRILVPLVWISQILFLAHIMSFSTGERLTLFFMVP